MNILFDGNYLIHKTFSIWSMYYQDRKKTPEENDAALIEAMRDKDKLMLAQLSTDLRMLIGLRL